MTLLKGFVMKLKITLWILAFIMLSSVTAWADLNQTQVSQLYVSIFGRASEGEGNAYWQSQPDMATAAAAMLDTQAAKDYFGANLNTNQAFIEHIYLNTLNKTISDDFDGISYWINMLDTGTNRGQVVASLVGVIQEYAPDGQYYNPNDTATIAAYNQFTNRVEVSDYMAENVWNTPDNLEASTSFSHGLIVTDDSATAFAAMVVVNGFIDETVSATQTEYWGVFKTDDGTVINTPGGTTSTFSVCNEAYRSTGSHIELNLWTMVFLNNSVNVFNTVNDTLLANGTVDGDILFIESIDGDWSFHADYRNSRCCFDGTDGTTRHWHGIRMPNYPDPSSIGQNTCDTDYMDWFDNWTNELYAQSTVVDTMAGPVEYTIIGDSGPVLAFMHGGPGSYYSALAYFSDFMDKGFRCLTWSRPGFLRTPLSTGITPEAQADALAALLDTLSIDTIAVIGASAGGPPAYQFAIRHPNRIWALVQADSISQAYNPEVNPQPGVETWVYLINQDSGMWLYNAMFEYANLGTARHFIGMMSVLSDEQKDDLAESILVNTTKLDMLGKILLSMGPNSLLKVGTFNDIEHYAAMPPMSLEKITAPTLILHGTADGDVPAEDAIYAASKIAGSELYWVENGIHVAPLSENSEAAMNKMLDFLNQKKAPNGLVP